MMTLTYILAAIVLLGLCIFVHELGHLLGGRMVGIKARVFSLGYGKGFLKKKIGDTTYQITLIPLGGYCQFYGEDPSEERSGKEYEFLSAHPLKRVFTVVMGPMFNLFFGILIFLMMNLVGYAKETNRIYIPQELFAGGASPAYEMGLRSGDRIVGIDGKDVTGFTDIPLAVMLSKGKPMKVEFLRGDEKKSLSITPRMGDAGRYTIGVYPMGSGVLISDLVKGEAGEQGGLLPRDEVRALDGKPVSNPADFVSTIKKSAGRKTVFTVMRSGKTREISITPKQKDVLVFTELTAKGDVKSELTLEQSSLEKMMAKKSLKIQGKEVRAYRDILDITDKSRGETLVLEVKKDKLNGRLSRAKIGFIGAVPSLSPEMVKVRYGFPAALTRAFVEPFDFIVMNLRALGLLVSGKMNVRENLSGPIMIAKVAGDVAYYQGFAPFLVLMAKISIILMIMNLLPIPVVDGSLILFFLLEAVRGKPLNQKIMERIQTVGVVLLIILGVFVIFNDLSKLQFIQNIISVFTGN